MLNYFNNNNEQDVLLIHIYKYVGKKKTISSVVFSLFYSPVGEGKALI